MPTPRSPAPPVPVQFVEALTAPPPSPLAGRDADLYDALLGDWDAEVVDHLPDGTVRRQSAEMHFARVLEGRAVQDLWIVPALRDRSASSAVPGNRYGTTLRVYDPAAGTWRVTWWNPVSGKENRLVGRREGVRIVQTGEEDGKPIRWIFEEAGPERFHWVGESSPDGGHSWVRHTEFLARRRHAAPPAVELRAAWEWTDRPGHESLRLVRGADGATAQGSGVVVLDGEAIRFRYEIAHDARWRFRSARVEGGTRDAARTLELRRDADGGWTVDGARRPDLDGCEDVDLMATPYTNAPPLLAAPLSPGQRRAVRVAWVRFPALEVRAAEQEYTRLDAGEGRARYRYHHAETGFSAELEVDPDGLVARYGPWVRR